MMTAKGLTNTYSLSYFQADGMLDQKIAPV